jgi:predicted permease
MRTLLQDLKFGLRMLAKNPVFTAVAVLTLALGIGANTALFSVVNGVLLDPLPYPQPERLVALYSHTAASAWWSISYPNFLDWVRDNRSFSALAGYREDDFSLTGTGEPERVTAEMVSASFFPLLGVQPCVGRGFLPEEDQAGAAPVVMISSGLWKRKFGSEPSAVGKSLTLDGKAYTIVGVVPEDFRYSGNNFGTNSDVYVPIGQWDNPVFRDRKIGMGMDAVGRLKPGVTFEQARADMDALGRHLAEAYPDANKGTGITMVPLMQNMVGEIKPFLMVLLAAVGFVLLISCVNVANLLLARSTARLHEFAIRAALGANRGRVIRQLLTECILLGLGGGGLGVLLAAFGMRIALSLLPQALPRVEQVRLDGRVLLFTLATSILSGLLFGLAPGLKTSRTNLQMTLKEGGRGLSGARHGVQRVLVAGEVALALVLLAGAGLMIRSLVKLWNVDPGFDRHNVLTFRLALPRASTSTPEGALAAWRRLEEQLNAVPGVQSASLTVGAMPLAGDEEFPFWVEGQPKPATEAEMKQAIIYNVQPGYLKVMRTPLQRGRFLSPADDEHSPLVAVIDERFQQIYFGHQDPIGQRIHFPIIGGTAEIVGVLGHVKQWGLDADTNSSMQAQCYLAMAQIPSKFVPLLAGYTGIALRTAGSPLAQIASLRHALHQVNSEQVMYNTRTMDEIVSDSLAARRFSMVLLGVFAGLALVMACVGVYGVVSYINSQRTHEIGIRMALGADRMAVLRMVLGEGVKMSLVGVAIGLVAAFGLTRLMANMLFGVSTHDPLSFAAVAGLLVLVALAACSIPARRATKTDPLVALRYE